MHVKDLLIAVLGDQSIEPEQLFLNAMKVERRRPVSLEHFEDCLDQLAAAKRVELVGHGGKVFVRALGPIMKVA